MEVEVPARDRTSKLHIATAKCSYQDVFSAKTAMGETTCSVAFSDKQSVVDQSINPAVQIEYTRNIVAENRDKVIALCEDGKQAEAVAVLKDNVELLNDGATRWGEQKFKQDAEEQQNQWQQLEKQGLTKQYRKRLRNDSYDDRNQQSFQSRVLRK